MLWGEIMGAYVGSAQICQSVSSPQSQRSFSGYVEAAGSCSYKDPPLHPPPLILPLFKTLSFIRERERGTESRQGGGEEKMGAMSDGSGRKRRQDGDKNQEQK